MASCPHDGTGVYCDCCGGREKLAALGPDGLHVQDGRHGAKHVAVASPREVLERLTGTTDGSAIMTVVRSLVG